MKYIYTPWRWKYIKKAIKGDEACIFCEAQKKSDEEALILYRGKHNIIIMNLYPYNNGHIMIAPREHISSPDDAKPEVLFEMSLLAQASIKTLRELFSPHGFNIGMNIGRTAGAGVVDHFHLHVVPRWDGDSNFMAVFSDTKVIALEVREVYNRLREPLIRHIQNLTKID